VATATIVKTKQQQQSSTQATAAAATTATTTLTTTMTSAITIRGSAELVAEFFGYSVNSILFQRGVYPPDSFARVQKYGLGLFVTNDEDLKRFITSVLTQMQSRFFLKFF
jgi:hypothetical protein